MNNSAYTDNSVTMKILIEKNINNIIIDSNIRKLFKNDMVYLEIISELKTIIKIFIQQDSINLTDITKIIDNIQHLMHETARRLSLVQINTTLATQHNLFLNKVHSSYGVILLELNYLIDMIIKTLEQRKLSSQSFINITNEPYTIVKEVSNSRLCCFLS